MYEVLLHPDAEKVYLNADRALAKKIARCFQQLEQVLVVAIANRGEIYKA
jgi:hypothetical protein